MLKSGIGAFNVLQLLRVSLPKQRRTLFPSSCPSPAQYFTPTQAAKGECKRIDLCGCCSATTSCCCNYEKLFCGEIKECAIIASSSLLILHANLLCLSTGWWCTDKTLESALKVQKACNKNVIWTNAATVIFKHYLILYYFLVCFLGAQSRWLCVLLTNYRYSLTYIFRSS